jgi:hypothetical protein
VSKVPPSVRTPSIKAPSIKTPSLKAPSIKVVDSTDRLGELEAQLAKANAEIDLLRQKTDAMRADIGALRSLVMGVPGSAPSRKGPPPLPIEHLEQIGRIDRKSSPDIIMVDERDVTLESIRPKGR